MKLSFTDSGKGYYIFFCGSWYFFKEPIDLIGLAKKVLNNKINHTLDYWISQKVQRLGKYRVGTEKAWNWHGFALLAQIWMC